MPTNYDPQILQDYVDDLYKQAKFIIITTALKYGLIMFLVSVLGCSVLARLVGSATVSDTVSAIVIFTTLIGIAVGVDAGRRKAFRLKLDAQELLCQRQIERNTDALLSLGPTKGPN